MLNRIIRKWIGNDRYYAKQRDFLLKNGNLKVGDNSDISACKFFFPDNLLMHNCNISIGRDCLLEGIIVLYQPNAKVSIGDRVFMGKDTGLYCYENIEIGDDIMFSWGITVMDTNAHSLIWEERKDDVINWKKGASFKDWSKVKHGKITINSKSWIGFNSIILKGVTIGEGAVIAAGSVVISDVKDFTVVGGNPARFIKETK